MCEMSQLCYTTRSLFCFCFLSTLFGLLAFCLQHHRVNRLYLWNDEIKASTIYMSSGTRSRRRKPKLQLLFTFRMANVVDKSNTFSLSALLNRWFCLKWKSSQCWSRTSVACKSILLITLWLTKDPQYWLARVRTKNADAFSRCSFFPQVLGMNRFRRRHIKTISLKNKFA